MVVAGFDPGSLRFGLGILKREGARIIYLHSEVVRFGEKDFQDRMTTLWKRLNETLDAFPVTSGAIEEGFLGKNVRSMSMLAQVNGLVLGCMISRQRSLSRYSPRKIKRAITGNGNAAKSQVARMVSILLNLHDRDLSEDESDALAVAYCHMLQHR